MQPKTIVLSLDKIRGALLTKALQKEGFKCNWCKNIFTLQEMIEGFCPSLMVIDCEGLYQNELAVLSTLNSLLKQTSVLVVSSKPNYGMLNIKAPLVKWCICSPLDLELVCSMAKELTTTKTDDTLKDLLPLDKEDVEDATADTEEEKLEDDLTGYLGLK